MAIPREGFESIVHAHQAMLYRIAFNFFRNVHTAEEVVQDVLLRLFESRASIESQAHLVAWLRRAATHRCIGLARRRSAQVETQVDTMPDIAEGVPESDPLLYERLRVLVASLPEIQRLVVILRYGEDMNSDEIGAIHIRGFEIERAAPDAYRRRVQPIRDLLKAPEWVRYAANTSGNSEMEIWSARWGNSTKGVLLLSITGGKQVFIMNVTGNLRPDQLIYLSGVLGIPNFILPLGQH